MSGPGPTIAIAPPASDATARRLLALLVHQRGAVAGAVAVLVAAAAQLALTWLVKRWSDALLGVAEAETRGAILGTAVVVLAVLLVAVFLSHYLLAALELRLQQALRVAALDALLHAELATAQGAPVGERLSRLFHDAAQLAGLVQDLLRRGLGGVAVGLGALAMMLLVDARLAVAIGLTVPVAGGLLVVAGRHVRRASQLAQEELGEATAIASEELQGLATIKAATAESEASIRFAAAGGRFVARSLVAELWASGLVTAVWLATAGGLVAAVWYGSGEVAAGRRTPGDLLAFALYAAQVIEPLRRLSELQGHWQRALAAATRVFSLVDLPAESATEGDHKGRPQEGLAALSHASGPTGVVANAAVGATLVVAMDATAGDLRASSRTGIGLTVDDVHFAYRADVPVLAGLSFSITGGESAALVAASGGGKSTLAGLLLGFATPGRGTLRLDGVNLATLDRRLLRETVAVAFQEPFLFRGTLAENLRLGCADVSDARLREAAELAGLTQLLRGLPRGLASDLVEAGRALSGGERQRIALARAVLREPRLLVLDEATSAVDSDNEEAILDRLAPWLAQRTVLLMAHRLSTVGRWPRVLVVDGGRLVGDGAPTTLLETCAPFRQLFAAQVAPVGAGRAAAASARMPEPPVATEIVQ